MPQTLTSAPIDSLEPHPRNPRQGDVGAIALLIAQNGWYGAVHVQDRDPLRIAIGEHRWRALRALQTDGITMPDGQHLTYAELRERVQLPPPGKVPIIKHDWDDDLTLRVLLEDNRSQDLAAYDDGALADILQELAERDGLHGTGFDGDDLDQLLRDLDTDVRVPLQDQRSVAERAGVYNSTDVRQIVVVMSPVEFPVASDTLEAAMREYELETHSDAALHLWRLWAAQHAERVDTVRTEREGQQHVDGDD